MIDLNGWEIIPQDLQGYRINSWNEDYFEETEGKRYGVCLYNIDELRMGDYYGQMGIYENHVYPTLILMTEKPLFILNPLTALYLEWLHM